MYPTIIAIHLIAATIWTGGHIVTVFRRAFAGTEAAATTRALRLLKSILKKSEFPHC
ncbi:MAG: hypothetical protein U1F27_12640 [Turneriella sp.]